MAALPSGKLTRDGGAWTEFHWFWSTVQYFVVIFDHSEVIVYVTSILMVVLHIFSKIVDPMAGGFY